MTPLERTSLLIPRLYPYQSQLLQSQDKELVINKSRQTGISYLLAAKGLLEALADRETVLIVSPSLRQSKHMMDYIYGYYNRLKQVSSDLPQSVSEETKTSILFKDGGEVHSLPNSADTIRGFKADRVYMDEFAHFTNGTDKEIVNALYPSLSRGGSVMYVSTPFGDQNLFYHLWTSEKIPRLLVNWRECPDFQPATIMRIRDTIGEDAFLQEYENQFLSDYEGQEFPTQLIHSCVDHDLQYTDLDPKAEYLGGADIGRVHDLTAFYALQHRDKTLVGCNKRTMRQAPYDEQKAFFNYILDHYRFSKFRIDESGIGNNLAEDVHRGHHGVERVTFNNETKQALVGNLKTLMQEGRLRFPDDPELVECLRSIQRVYTPSNYIKFESRRDDVIGHADLFWALALAVKDEARPHGLVLPVAKGWT